MTEIILLSSVPCTTNANCPAAYMLPTGDIALIGEEVSAELHDDFPPGPRVGAGERMVVVPRAVLLEAAGNLTEAGS